MCRIAGDLEAAKEQLVASLKMKRALYVNQDHLEIAVTLYELGIVYRQRGRPDLAKQTLEESLRMKRSLHEKMEHCDFALTLQEMGLTRVDDGPSSLSRSLHGSFISPEFKDGQHLEFAVVLHELGLTSRDAGNFTEAKQQLEESLQMKRSLHGDGDSHDFAGFLFQVGQVSRKVKDLPAEESWKMTRSLYGEGNHLEIALVLDELGLTCQDANENEEAKQHLTASL